jgi:hypothetical protein
VIAHNVDNVWELKTATLEEITEPLSFFLSATEHFEHGSGSNIFYWKVVQILGNHNVTTENQNIVVLIILDVDVAEF